MTHNNGTRLPAILPELTTALKTIAGNTSPSIMGADYSVIMARPSRLITAAFGSNSGVCHLMWQRWYKGTKRAAAPMQKKPLLSIGGNYR